MLNPEEIPIFILDDSVLVEMMECKKTSKTTELLAVIKKIKNVKDNNLPLKIVIPLASFLSAVWKVDPNVKIGKVQEIMGIVDIIITPEKDYKDKTKVMNDLVSFANKLSTMRKSKG